MKTIDELKAELAQAEAEASRLWDEYKALEKSQKVSPKTPLQVAEENWFAASKRRDSLIAAIAIVQ